MNADFRHTRSHRRRYRRQRRKGHGRDRCLDLRPRYFLARPQLESHCDRSRTMKLAMRPVAARRAGLRLLVILVALTALPLAALGEGSGPIVLPDTQYEPVEWADLDGWTSDDHAAPFAPFLRRCPPLPNRHPHAPRLPPIPPAL